MIYSSVFAFPCIILVYDASILLSDMIVFSGKYTHLRVFSACDRILSHRYTQIKDLELQVKKLSLTYFN